MFHIFQNGITKNTFMAVTFCLSFSSAFAQYPEIPKDVQAKTDTILAREEKRLGEIWKNNANNDTWS